MNLINFEIKCLYYQYYLNYQYQHFKINVNIILIINFQIKGLYYQYYLNYKYYLFSNKMS